MLQKTRNNPLVVKNKKGFTLVEVIVVLVILAILAAILVPKLTGWIDESKVKVATGEGHLILSALQAEGSEQYADDGGNADYDTTAKANVKEYLEGDFNVTDRNPSAVLYKQSQVQGFYYTASNGVKMKYEIPISGAQKGIPIFVKQ